MCRAATRAAHAGGRTHRMGGSFASRGGLSPRLECGLTVRPSTITRGRPTHLTCSPIVNRAWPVAYRTWCAVTQQRLGPTE